MIPVTKPFLPPIEEYQKYVSDIWDRNWLTNNGPLVQQLEKKLRDYLGVEHIFFMGNGTVAIQIGLKSLGIKKQVITTPFSYVATTSSILWEGCTPVFADINESDLNINVDKIEQAITADTEAILATHVYGNPCDVNAISVLAQKYNLKVIYDGAHAFGTVFNGKSLLAYGDIATCSFHATKVFHTTEGGAIICHDKELADKIFLQRSFGHLGDDHFAVGINGKNSEFHAAMGLCNFNYVEEIINSRKIITNNYNHLLHPSLQRPVALPGTDYNYAYYPVILPNEEVLNNVVLKLNKADIFPRRYFYPSLNTLSYLTEKKPCPVAENFSLRVLSLPLYVGLQEEEIEKISEIINSCI
ncbi:MAG: DegT/DnrJ/EryC1/StrS family aminotransferase [Ferruginibacter sp.]